MVSSMKNLTDVEQELVNSLEVALSRADLLKLQLVAIKIVEALDHFRISSGNVPAEKSRPKDTEEQSDES